MASLVVLFRLLTALTTPILFFLILGFYLRQKFNIPDWALFLLILVGVCSGFYLTYKEVTKISDNGGNA